jgi:flagellar protein FliS
MINGASQSYKTSNISTADRGKLIVMIYDHCIKWCRTAVEKYEEKNIEAATKAVFRAQDGIVELQCSLDMENGGDIAKNLFNLYAFYNRHLTEAITKKQSLNITQVQDMMSILRKTWVEAIEKVRQEDRSAFSQKPNNQIQMVG